MYFCYSMENGLGDLVTVSGREGDVCRVDYLDNDGEQRGRVFPTEEAAYAWAFRRGYRD